MTGIVARATDSNVDRATDSLNGPLRRGIPEPLHRQLASRLRSAVIDGRLRPGAALIATRVLALELGVARITVQTAYDQLVAEGYLEVHGRRGTRVASDLPALGPATTDPAAIARSAHYPPTNRWIADAPVTEPEATAPAALELGPEWFGLEALDRRRWERLLVRAWRTLANDPDGPATTYAGPLGDVRLRTSLADHLAVHRGVRCHPDSIAITAGSTAAFAAIARTWLGPGRLCVMEDPGGEQIRRALGGSGATIMPVPVDDGGLCVERLPERADILFVTPSWQYPAGGSLSLRRRLDVLRWADRCGAIVVEDDCESELRYAGRPSPSLQGLADDGRVIYVSTFSKVVFPGLRTGYMVVPDAYRGRLLAALEAGGRSASALEQRVLAMFLEDGAFDRHVRRVRAILAARRNTFADTLAATGAPLEVRRAIAGGHLIVGILDPTWTATRLADALAEVGVRVEPLDANRRLEGRDDELVVYLSRPDDEALRRAATVLARTVGQTGRVPLASRRRTVGRIPPPR
jgi:GntR family transcriptional regulator / MocR family aminotransferase